MLMFSHKFISQNFDSFQSDKNSSNFEEVFDEFIVISPVHLFIPLGVIHHVHFISTYKNIISFKIRNLSKLNIYLK